MREPCSCCNPFMLHVFGVFSGLECRFWVHRQHAGHISAATRRNVATTRSIENGYEPPLPSPLLQRKRGRATRRLLAQIRATWTLGPRSSGRSARSPVHPDSSHPQDRSAGLETSAPFPIVEFATFPTGVT